MTDASPRVSQGKPSHFSSASQPYPHTNPSPDGRGALINR
ncbi:UNVERIFIED_ORG: hypothetical protein GGR68_001921 [Xanthomonas campestris]|uniref:Uncharacterized protein n=1 Tax=Xanthomonas arboricola TaxID=56448 RepID=A0AAU9HZC6_9XANT|nr:hypothetical protein [Xanthomonas arboricola]CAE6754362.1 hypothetical protein XA1314C_17410 [Xanthomonas arboricola]CAE6754387.1 hypothetical protein XA1314C_17410 [Xanthomonas arboricola]